MAVEHTLKCWPDYFDAIQRGEKPFDVRRDDRGFQKGDTLLLQKFDPKRQRYVTSPFDHICELRRKVTYVLTGGQFGIEPGYVVLGLSRR